MENLQIKTSKLSIKSKSSWNIHNRNNKQIDKWYKHNFIISNLENHFSSEYISIQQNIMKQESRKITKINKVNLIKIQ